MPQSKVQKNSKVFEISVCFQDVEHKEYKQRYAVLGVQGVASLCWELGHRGHIVRRVRRGSVLSLLPEELPLGYRRLGQ
ncbi:hypothetical protein LWC08_03065 [Desulfobaculum bizertense]|uniref:hypothetical protein n=1 Tax=Desulfobaculum bizertense TaxID=376490 RepID=UPI001F3040BA|nr:hypothetical protein [Desulfobaculum bizertense]UIJ38564.1 hypothetical protein LWC08_03065 [Desulfobaculum bizertense]